MSHENITFTAGGVELRGSIFHPPDPTRPAPTVVMAHGFGAVKDQ